jgi:4-amino-4-deoxy-L-arabinose transferase-like glycosyltransferase
MKSEASEGDSKRGGIAIAVIAMLLGVFACNAWLAVRGKCATADEPLHLMGAYMQAHFRDFRIDDRDPPLWLRWAMLPVPAEMLKVDTKSKAWQLIPKEHWHDWEWSVATLYRTKGNDADAVLTRARAMMLVVAMAGMGLTAWWSWRLGGAAAAVIATAMLAFDPNFLAHAALMKNDVALTFALLWVMAALWRLGSGITVWRAINLVLAVAVCVNVKFSGLLCAGLVPVGLLVWAVLEKPYRKRIAVALGLCMLIGATTYLSIWACYGFRFAPTNDPAVRLRMSPIVELVAEREIQLRHPHVAATREEHKAWKPGAFVRAVLWAEERQLFPQAWLHGLLYTYQSTINYPSFLLGKYSESGWWYYFPVVLLCKTPVGILLLLVMGVAVGTSRLHRQDARAMWDVFCLALPIVVYGWSALRTNTNLGVRHILPVVPFLYIACAVALSAAMRTRWVRVLTPLLLLAVAVETLASFPNYLPFFNVATRSKRLELLSDSNIDWGQELPLLKQWQKKHPKEKLYLCYFGMVDPSYYGIRYTGLRGTFVLDGEPKVEEPVEPGVIAISANHLQGTFLSPNFDLYARYRKMKPIAVLGGSIYLFDYPGKEN